MHEFLQQLINGLSLGAIYALIAVGYTMVYGVLQLINFAHGDVFMVGAVVAYFLVGAMRQACTESPSAERFGGRCSDRCSSARCLGFVDRVLRVSSAAQASAARWC